MSKRISKYVCKHPCNIETCEKDRLMREIEALREARDNHITLYQTEQVWREKAEAQVEALREELEKESFYARKQKALRLEQVEELREGVASVSNYSLGAASRLSDSLLAYERFIEIVRRCSVLLEPPQEQEE